MEDTLEQKFDKILETGKEVVEEVKSEEPVVVEKEIIEELGVEKAAVESESQQEQKTVSSEGDEIPSEFEEELKNIDPELRAILLKADAETRKTQLNAFKKMRSSVDKKMTELGQKKKIAETAEELFQKYGVDAASGLSQVERLILFEKELEKDPRTIVEALRKKFNLDDASSGSEEKLDETYLSEEEKFFNKKIQKIEKTNEFLLEENRKLKDSKELEEVERAKKEIVEFRDRKNEDGALQNPYFNELFGDIGKLTVLYPNDNIDKLYNRALRLNDDIYNKSIEDVKERERVKILTDKEIALKKAKSMNSQSFKSSSRSDGMQSLDDRLGNILEKAGFKS